ncbi:MAG: GNAT family N-acetyltransferase [bacterium]
MIIKLEKNINKEHWNDLVKNSFYSTVYHTWEWLESLKKTYLDWEIFYLMAYEKEKILAGLPIIKIKEKIIRLRYFSSMWGSYGGVIVRDEENFDIKEKMLDYFKNFFSFWKIISIELVDFYSQNEFVKNMGFTEKKQIALILSLNNSLEEIWKEKIKYKIRKNVKRAENNGIEIKEITNIEMLKNCFHLIEQTNYRHKMKKVQYPYKLYENMFLTMGSQNLIKWNVAFYKKIPIALLFSFVFKKNLVFWINASSQEFWQHRPNDYLYWYQIKWACLQNLTYANFGTTLENNEELIRFKQSFGAEKKYYSIYTYFSSFLKLKQ